MTTPATIKQGSTGAVVTQWQQVLGITADGKFGPATVAATKTWQAAHGLVADGVVGPKSWTAAQPVTVAVKPIVQTVVKTITTTTKPTIKNGSSGVAVVEWQGIVGVTADGKFGPATETATKIWQSARGLTADGIVGPQSWNAAAINVPITQQVTNLVTSLFNTPTTVSPEPVSTTNPAPAPTNVVQPTPLGSFAPVTTPVTPRDTSGAVEGVTLPSKTAEVVVPIPPQTVAVTSSKFTIPTWSKWVASILALVGFGYGVKYSKEHKKG